MNWVGLAAETWDATGGNEAGPDHDFFLRLIRTQDGPALDVGCGTGRLLLRYLRAGADVDGLDSSPDMLRICRQKAEQFGVQPALYLQSVQYLDLPRRYATVFIPGGTFGLVPQADVAETLRRLHLHLLPAGALAVTLFSPYGPNKPLREGEISGWRTLVETELPDGARVVHDFQRLSVDRVRRTLTELKRYRILAEGAVVAEDALVQQERWYEPDEFTSLLRQAGFRDVDVQADFSDQGWTRSDDMMVFVAHR